MTATDVIHCTICGRAKSAGRPCTATECKPRFCSACTAKLWWDERGRCRYCSKSFYVSNRKDV